MLRFLLSAILMLFFLRLIFWVARLLTAGSRSPEGGGRVHSGYPEPDGGDVPARSRPGRARVDRSTVTDVPFTELPPEGAAGPAQPARPPESAEPAAQPTQPAEPAAPEAARPRPPREP